MEEKNLLVSEDDLIQEPETVSVAAPMEPIVSEPVQLAENVNTVPAQPEYNVAMDDVGIPVDETKKVEVKENKPINENPMGKIKLNTTEEKEEEKIDPSTIKLDFKGNNNLKYVFVLGLILLIAIFLIPVLITK